ncbi:MAG TPA: carboxypeptidase regulatory-like domain-containing protein [Thermoplasmata archaeon]|nr:carboxypeptidase regulatory-like domain-containing protein [Thermoplasmata archaeon]
MRTTLGRREVGRKNSLLALASVLGILSVLVLLLSPTLPLSDFSHGLAGAIPGAAFPAAPKSLTPSPAVSYPTPIRHVFVVFLENAELSTVQSNGKYMMGLAKNYTEATHYYAPCHPSAPEYLAATSGATWQCGSDSVTSGGYSTNNIGNLSQHANLSWAGYMESMPSACDANDSYPYAARHNPFVYYSDISGTVCNNHDLSFSSWNSTVKSGTIPAFAFFSPNLKNDGHDTSVSYADGWLKHWLPPYLNASWFNDSVWFITYDEGSTNSGYNGFGGGHVYFTAVSPYSVGGRTYSNNSTHYNLLSTVEWLLGLGGTGNNDSTSKFPAMKGLFNFSSNQSHPASYSLSGTVTASATGIGVSGATVGVTGGSQASTNATGHYALSLTNGTYTVTASAAGLVGSNASVTIKGAAQTLNFSLANATHSASKYLVSGTVEYWYNYTAAPGATVQVVGGSSMQTGSNGSFWFSEPNGTYTLTAWKTGYNLVTQNVTVAGKGASLVFLLPRFYWEVSGAVTDHATGKAIPGANISVVAGPLSTGQYSLANASGGYALWLPNATFTLGGSAVGYHSANATVTVSGSASLVNFSLTPQNGSQTSSYGLRGTVTFGTNRSAAAGVAVSIAPGYSATTNASGGFTAQVPNGTYLVSTVDPGWYSASQSVTILGGGASVSLVLYRATYALSGKVTFAPNGSFAPGVSIGISPGYSTTTNASGGFSVQVPNGTYRVSTADPGWYSASQSVTILGAAAAVSLSLHRTLYTLSGKVTYAANGSAASGVGIDLSSGNTTTTNASGGFAMRVPNGTYVVSTVDPGWVSASQRVTILGSGASTSLTLSRAAYTVSGSVTYSANQSAAPGVTVSISPGFTATTNALGQFSVNVPNGTYLVTATQSGFYPATQTVSVTGASVSVSLVLTLATYPLSGKVTFGNNGSPAPGIEIRIKPGYSAQTNSSGEFTVLVPNGSYQVSASYPGWHSIAQPSTISGKGASVTLELTRQKYQVTGVVLMPNSSPCPGVVVSVPTVPVSALTDINGTYNFSVANGSYSVQVSRPGILPLNLSLVVAGAPVTLDIRVMLPSNSSQPPTPSPQLPSKGSSWTGWFTELVGLFFTPWVLLAGLLLFSIASGAALHRRAVNRRRRSLTPEQLRRLRYY